MICFYVRRLSVGVHDRMKCAFKILSMLFLFFFITGCQQRVMDKEQVSTEEKIVIRFSHVVAENTPKGLAAKRFSELVKKRTNGRVEVQVFPNSTLYQDGEEMDALLDGSVQMIAPTTSKLSEMSPPWLVFDLPYIFENEQMVYKAVQGEMGKILFDSLETRNIKPLAFWNNGFKQVSCSTRPLIHPADFNGLNIRVMINSSLLKQQFRHLGAVPTSMPFGDVYNALAKGVIDGQENTISNYYSKKFYKVQPYLTMSNHGYMGYVVLVNKNFWDSIPEAERIILEETMSEVTAWEWLKATEINKDDYEKIKLTGEVQIYELNEEGKEEWKRAFYPLYDEFAGVIGENLMQLVSELNK